MILTVCCLALFVTGCGVSNRPPTKEEEDDGVIAQVGELYRNYQLTKNKPPDKLADLTAVRSMAGNGFEAVSSGKVVLRYGATLPDTKEEPGRSSSEEVLAYQKQVPESGGKVLLLNRTVKAMTADEFKAATKAGKEPPALSQAKKSS
ncbi:MAG TPA: hypothetical protein VGZ22_24730 [Isosphaeraceae bacterium]|nr:hypothetical protein [Isosphaeraceae bacterium]